MLQVIVEYLSGQVRVLKMDVYIFKFIVQEQLEKDSQVINYRYEKIK